MRRFLIEIDDEETPIPDSGAWPLGASVFAVMATGRYKLADVTDIAEEAEHTGHQAKRMVERLR